MAYTQQTAREGDWVAVQFTGILENDLVFDASPDDQPLIFQIGSGIVLADFENEVIGMAEGQEKTFTVRPENAFGIRDASRLKTFDLSDCPDEIKTAPEGHIVKLCAEGSDRPMAGEIVYNDGKTIQVDLNHPLAGHALCYTVKLINISPVPHVS